MRERIDDRKKFRITRFFVRPTSWSDTSMKNPARFLSRLAVLSVGVAAAFSLTSCVYTTDPGYGSYNRVGTTYRTGYGSSYGSLWGFGGGGYRSGYCNICRSYNCRGHHDHDRHRYDYHDDHRNEYRRSSSSSHDRDNDLKHRDNAYRIAGGSTGSKKKPTGYHSPEWYESRGYDTSRLRLESESGDRYRSSSSSSSSRSSSSSSHKSSSSSSHRSSGSSSGSSAKKSSSSSSSASRSSGGGSSGRSDNRKSGSSRSGNGDSGRNRR